MNAPAEHKPDLPGAQLGPLGWWVNVIGMLAIFIILGLGIVVLAIRFILAVTS